MNPYYLIFNPKHLITSTTREKLKTFHRTQVKKGNAPVKWLMKLDKAVLIGKTIAFHK